MSEYLVHYGVKGMKWGKHLFGQPGSEIGSKIGGVIDKSDLTKTREQTRGAEQSEGLSRLQDRIYNREVNSGIAVEKKNHESHKANAKKSLKEGKLNAAKNYAEAALRSYGNMKVYELRKKRYNAEKTVADYRDARGNRTGRVYRANKGPTIYGTSGYKQGRHIK